MFKTDRLLKLVITVFFALVLGACGSGGDGGGGGGSGDGAGDGTGGSNPTPASARFIDAPVDGLNFTSAPSGASGTTGNNGGFVVESGDTASFNIGGLSIGTSQQISDGNIITPAELAGNRFDANNPKAIRIARLLQSLDNDANTTNGIVITASTHAYFSGLTQAERDSLQSALNTGTGFDLLFGDRIHLMTAGNTVPRAQGDLVTASRALLELLAAVSQATGGGGFEGGDSDIVAAATGNCPVGVLSSNRVAVFGQSFPVCVINEDITTDVTLQNDHVYVIEGLVNVGNGDIQGATAGGNRVIFIIQPGTQIYGYGGTTASLVVTRGSKIEAIGLPEMPIIMGAVDATGSGANLAITSDPADLTGRGQWSGLIISGRGFTSAGNDIGEVQATSVPQGVTRFYGDGSGSDSSATLEYVILAEAGRPYTGTARMHALTLEAVGSGTRLNHVQVLGSGGDGIRWFGGGAHVAHVVVNGQSKDGLSFSEGFNGLVQQALVRMGETVGDNGMAGVDGDPTEDGRPNFINVTLLGKNGAVETASTGVDYRGGVDAVLWRSAILDDTGTAAWDGGCLSIEEPLDPVMAFRDVAVKCDNGEQASPAAGGQFGVTGLVTESFVEGTTIPAFPQDHRDFSVADGIPFNAQTLAIDTWAPFDHPKSSVPLVFFETEIGDYFGAVNPISGNPDGDPTNNINGGGPFWDGWTYRNTNVEGNLPGDNFHPLEAEITP